MSELIVQNQYPQHLAELLRNRPIPDKFSSNLVLKHKLEQKINSLLDEVGPWKNERQQAVSKIIARSVVDACADLGVPAPDIEIGYLTTADATFYRKLYKIKIHEHFLKKLNKMRFFGFYLRAKIFHECYHAWQELNFPGRTQRFFDHLEALDNLGAKGAKEAFDQQLLSRYEISANLYMLKEIKNVETESAIQLLEKARALIGIVLWNKIFKKERRVKKNLKF